MKYIITEEQFNMIKESDLEYLDSHWRETSKKLEDIIDKLKNELPYLKNQRPTKVSDKLRVAKHSDMEDEWNVEGKSTSLDALANKIVHMIRTGKSDGVKRMVEKIATGRIKSLSQPRRNDNEYLGKGHFRWNWKAYTLTPREIERVKEFFNL